MMFDECPSDVTAHREAAKVDRLGDVHRVEQGGEFVGVGLHRDGVVGHFALTETAEVGGDDGVRCGEVVDLAGPHGVIEREPVHEEQGGAGALGDNVRAGIVDRVFGHGLMCREAEYRGGAFPNRRLGSRRSLSTARCSFQQD